MSYTVIVVNGAVAQVLDNSVNISDPGDVIVMHPDVAVPPLVGSTWQEN